MRTWVKQKWRWEAATNDIARGMSAWQIWWMLAYQDVRQRYIRSVLGEFWISLSLGISILAIGTLYGGLFGFSMAGYLPYLAAGVAGWTFISASLVEGAQAFIADYVLLLQSSLPKSIYVYRVVLRSSIVFAHNVIIVILTCLVFGSVPGWSLFALVPNFLLVAVNVAWMALFLAIVATRFRDIPPILTNVLQLLFFVTPIIWRPEQVPEHLRFVVLLNPFAIFLDLLRAPFLGTSVSEGKYAGAILLAMAGWTITVALFSRARHRIVYWL